MKEVTKREKGDESQVRPVNHIFRDLKENLYSVSKILTGLPGAERGKVILLAVMLLTGVALIILGGMNRDKPEKTVLIKEEAVTTGGVQGKAELWAEERVENELLSILMRIKGVGRVKVDLTYSQSAEEQWVFRLNEEERVNREENGGAIREWRSQKEPVLRREKDGVEEPIRVKTIAPRIAGVLVVAEGVEDPVIKERVWTATATLLGIPMHRVIVVAWGE